MIIGPHRVAAGSPTARSAPPPPPPEDPGPLPWDSHAAYQFAAGGTRYMFSKLSTRLAVLAQFGLYGEAPASLPRPFLAVVGFNGRMADTRPLLNHLSADGRNGGCIYYLQGDQVYSDADLSRPLPSDWTDSQAKVFQLVPQHRQQSPEVTAQQLQFALKTIERVTGSATTDVAAHSMGGLGARLYGSQGGHGIGKLMMVGTPNQGIRAATMANWAIKSGIGFAMKLGGLGPDAGPALDWLQAISDGNPKLEQLNSRWSQDKQQLEKVMVLGSTGRLTSQASPQEWGPGDGLVDSASLSLQDTPVQVLPGTWSQGHVSLMNDRETFRTMTAFFGWTPG
ncbi:hypothetical protein IV102_22275 [bacterium]|nr:hypothetical protein [bacterium]